MIRFANQLMTPFGRRVVLMLLALVLCASAGCTRRFFRNRADREVAGILAEKDVVPDWKIEDYHVYPDPRARFADTTNPDRPPMPPDDPATRMLSPNPQRPKLAGIAHIEGAGYLDLLAMWDAQNRQQAAAAGPDKADNAIQQAGGQTAPKDADEIKLAQGKGVEELPVPRKTPAHEPQPYLINLEQAVELGRINSREYQTKREDLYLSALAVTLQRFGFAAQFFFTEEAARNWSGRATPEGQQSNWALRSSTGFSKLFPTGALLLLKFANTTVIDLTRKLPHDVDSVSTLNLDLVQPFLQGGGRAVTLEPLTQAERNLVYEIRGYARFRELFFANIVTGGDLNLFTVQPVRQGYYPTLLRRAQLEIDRKNLEDLRANFDKFEKFEQRGDFPKLQLETVRNQILQSENTIARDEQDLRDAIDAFKLQLGLPLTVPIDLTFEPLQPVQDQLNRLEAAFAAIRDAQKTVTDVAVRSEPSKLRPALQQSLVSIPLVEGTAFQKSILPRWAEWESEKLNDAALAKKIVRLEAQVKKLAEERQSAIDAEKPWTEEQERQIKAVEADKNLGEMEHALRAYEAQPWLKVMDKKKADDQRLNLFDEVLDYLDLVLGEARAEGLSRVTRRWPALAPIEIAGIDVLKSELDLALETGTETARNNRFDLMNARAQLVDSWRQITVSANSLLGVFNVGYHLTGLSPVGKNQPLNVTGSHVRHQLAFNAELPLVRLPERNLYRTRLIEFQRERRDLMLVEDRVDSSIRGQIRQLRVLAQNFETQKKLVELAYYLRDASVEMLAQKPELAGRPLLQAPSGVTRDLDYVVLTNQYLQNQNNLLQRQAGLYTLWTNYHITRLQLYRDLELLSLDARGVWNDELAKRSLPADQVDPGIPPEQN